MTFKNKIKSPFLRNIFILFSGASFTQLIPLFSAPILSRIYLPEHYGSLGIFMSISTIITSVASFQYASGIMLTETKKSEDNLVNICKLFTFSVSVLTLTIIFITKNFFNTFYYKNGISIWIWLLPISIYINGLNVIYTNLLSKHKKFKTISISKVFIVVTTVSTSMLIGFYRSDEMGLFIGLILSQLIGFFILLIGSRKLKTNKRNISYLITRLLLRRYKKFFQYTLPSEFLGNWSGQLPIHMLTYFGGTAPVGLYNYSQRLILLPVNIISGSFRPVFAQRATSDYQKNGSCRNIFKKTFLMLFGIGIIPFSVLIFFAPEIFSFVFGEKWYDAGIFTQILAPMFFLKFIVNPLSFIFYLANKQNEDFILNIITITSTFLSLFFGYYFFESIYWMLIFYSTSYSIIYLIYLIKSYRYTEN